MHDALVHALAREEVRLDRRDDVDDRIADGEHVELCVSHRLAGPRRMSRGGDSGDRRRWRNRPRAGQTREWRRPQSLGRRGLRLEPAPLGDDAAIAFGLPRLADIAAVKDQPVVGVEQVLLRHHLEQPHLDLERRLARREAGAVGDAEDMRVDRDGRLRRRRC